MRFSERSKRGKRRILSVIGIGVLAVAGCVLLVIFSKNDLTGELADQYNTYYGGNDVIVTPVEEIKTTPVSTKPYDEVSGGGYTYRYEAAALQSEILTLVGNSQYGYAATYRSGTLTKEGFSAVFYEELGDEIPAEKVSVGDVGIGGGLTGICVGFIEGVPVFAYAAEKALYQPDYSGVCIGYVRGLNDATLCGMYPVAFTEFYDCCKGIGSDVEFNRKLAYLEENVSWYADALYDNGRAMSQKRTETLIDLMPEGTMHQCNVKILPDMFLQFLEGFAKQRGCPGGDYTLHVLKEISNREALVSLKVTCISLEEDTYLNTYGEWYVTMYRTFEFLPCGADLSSYISIVGFVQDNQITIKTDEEGNVSVEKEEIIYGYTTDESGRPIIRAADGSVLYLDTKVPAKH